MKILKYETQLNKIKNNCVLLQNEKRIKKQFRNINK